MATDSGGFKGGGRGSRAPHWPNTKKLVSYTIKKNIYIIKDFTYVSMVIILYSEQEEP